MRTLCDTQQPAEWYAARLGKVTASNADRAIAKLKRKDGESAARQNYRYELAAERIAGKTLPHFVSNWMLEGSQWEDFARAATEINLDTEVMQTGFVLHPTFDFFGASPDGLFADGGVLEIKCPKIETHLKYIGGVLDPWEEYGPQMQGEMICCEAPYVQFVSYCDWLPKHYQWFTRRYERDEQMVMAYELEIQQFESEVAAMVTELEAKMCAAA